MKFKDFRKLTWRIRVEYSFFRLAKSSFQKFIVEKCMVFLQWDIRTKIVTNSIEEKVYNNNQNKNI